MKQGIRQMRQLRCRFRLCTLRHRSTRQTLSRSEGLPGVLHRQLFALPCGDGTICTSQLPTTEASPARKFQGKLHSNKCGRSTLICPCTFRLPDSQGKPMGLQDRQKMGQYQETDWARKTRFFSRQ